MNISLTNALTTKANLLFKALAGESTEVRCGHCDSVERVILLDSSIEDAEMFDYRCGDCDGLDSASA
jgi:hypothetical protein